MSLNYKIFCTIYFWLITTNVSKGADFTGDSYEINRIDFSPFNDAILFNDIAEIINDFDSTMYPVAPSESDSDENIEDLLSEYQHYLDKAHKQKKIYEEKFKSKNKVPMLRHERFSKIKPFPTNKYVDYFNSLSNPFTFTEKSYDNNQLDFFVPFNPDVKYIHRPEPYGKTSYKNNHNEKEKTITEEKQFINLPLLSPRINYDLMKSPCICKDNQIPCDCNCKQCLMPIETTGNDNFDQSKHVDFADNKAIFSPMAFNNDNIFENSGFSNRPTTADNDLNIRIKVDIQLPRILESLLKQKNRSQDKELENDEKNSKEARFLFHSPVSKLNFPIPIEIFGLKKPIRLNKHDSTSMHKITIHKKKKSKLNNNGNKKHKKKIITFHNIKFEPQVVPEINTNNNISNINKEIEDRDSQPQLLTFNNTQNINETNALNQSIPDIAPLINTSTSIIHGKASEIPFIIHNMDNKTYDFHKTENSIEVDFVKTVSNISTAMPKILRNRRSAENNKTITHDEKSRPNTKLIERKKGVNALKETKDNIKILNVDSELLYWPNNSKISNSTRIPKNITEIILERESNKVKLNISQETIRNNHTMALEHAIFGNVDWNDVDTIAPVFLSFMGKYIRGILTFCSQKTCHSMKCVDKACIHRICSPENRFNHRGHCNGSNRTDSVATMETVMDLPSNLALEIVDILQDKMLGKVFGKATLCIGTKCISLVASKKNFFKSKCSIKELDSSGHCRNIKHSKVM
ncbi:PREDICTED: uncharacterized protein LOC106115789 isoform X2 [Papilio xuthus]|uniref:Uncharacterized protein LOC106115789 isoform X2 n=1 Tax=Papilio xuthus TaxID=66420 RepID=A0AAJ6Z3L7_PAPXU|nr:PREDICTED: uncharacterized protein LOC106115789 isoform X2 [Papilio xuthus]